MSLMSSLLDYIKIKISEAIHFLKCIFFFCNINYKGWSEADVLHTNPIVYLYLIIENELLPDNKFLLDCKGSVNNVNKKYVTLF